MRLFGSEVSEKKLLIGAAIVGVAVIALTVRQKNAGATQTSADLSTDNGGIDGALAQVSGGGSAQASEQNAQTLSAVLGYQESQNTLAANAQQNELLASIQEQEIAAVQAANNLKAAIATQGFETQKNISQTQANTERTLGVGADLVSLAGIFFGGKRNTGGGAPGAPVGGAGYSGGFSGGGGPTYAFGRPDFSVDIGDSGQFGLM